MDVGGVKAGCDMVLVLRGGARQGDVLGRGGGDLADGCARQRTGTRIHV